MSAPEGGTAVPIDLDGGVAVVTGAASGIGFALGDALAKRGATVVLSDVDAAALADAGRQLTDAGRNVGCVAADVTDQQSVADLLRSASALGPVVVACLNAGVTTTGPATWLTDAAALDFVMRVNLVGVLNGIRSAVPAMVEHGRPGGLVITASMAGMVASPNSAVYSASKAAVVALAKSLRAELATAAPQLRVTVLNPGMVKTNLMRTSARFAPPTGGLTSDMVEVSHDALNTLGEEPDAIAAAALDALDAGEFWAFPAAGDPFVASLQAELAELEAALAADP
jgi:short-subunit dehydrogenase